jgi:hypothetical protein
VVLLAHGRYVGGGVAGSGPALTRAIYLHMKLPATVFT